VAVVEVVRAAVVEIELLMGAAVVGTAVVGAAVVKTADVKL